ncbi:MAG TPA: hypothetical protein VJH70_02990 [Candidatus Paceibacterota bacterium]
MLIKLLTATAILGVAIASAYLLIPTSVPGTPASANSNEIQQKIIGGMPRIESLQNNSNLSATAQQIITSTPIGEQNLTNSLIQKIQESIREKNQSGPQIVGGQSTFTATAPDNLAQQALQEATTNLPENSFRPIINTNLFNIIFDNNPIAIRNYFDQFQSIISAAGAKIPGIVLTDIQQITNPEILVQLINAYRSAAEQLAPIDVPSSLISIHKKELELLGTQANLFERISNFEIDPAAAILAINELENVNEEFIDLGVEINALFKK